MKDRNYQEGNKAGSNENWSDASNGYYDENGGYYDENGNYYDEYGGYYDEDGYYHDGQGGYYDAAGNYYYEDVDYYAEGYEGSEPAPAEESSDGLIFEDIERVNRKSSNSGGPVPRSRTDGYGRREDKYPTSYMGEKKKKKKRFRFRGMTAILTVVGALVGLSFGGAIGAVIGAMFLINPVLMGIIVALILGILLGAAAGGSVDFIAGRIALVVLTFILVNVTGLYFTLRSIYNGPEASRTLTASTIQETGQLKFVNKMFLSEEEILEITNMNSMGTLDAEVDTGLISVGGGSLDAENTESGEAAEAFDIDGFELVELSGRTYFAKLMIINDPSRVKLTTIYDGSWKEYGKTLDELVDAGNFLAGVNGGEYQSDSNKGGAPKGLVVCDGQIQYNNPYAGDVMVGFNTDDILIIRDIGGMSADSVKSLVAELNIRDAVTFKDIADGDDNHFTKLIINGESVSLNGSGSGANPRTVIGQKADGSVLLLVTDGRGAGGHLGATAADVISIMQEYGAVNAANLDGGSSSCMYCDGEWEMTSVTLYYSNASWRLPLAFVVERRD